MTLDNKQVEFVGTVLTRRRFLHGTGLAAGGLVLGCAFGPEKTAAPSVAEPATQYATHRGYRIAYDVVGDGPPVVFQHGLFGNRKSWAQVGYVAALSDSYRVITIDSLGHGDSDKPADSALYACEQRVGDIAAVLDNEGLSKAHCIGYSMGGWLVSGLARYQPERLLSLTVGGWDPVGGLDRNLTEFELLGDPVEKAGPPDFETALKLMSKMNPELFASITDEVRPALSAGWYAMQEPTVSAEDLAELEVPVLLWAGTDDSCIDRCRALAEEIDNVTLHEVAGDHGGALQTNMNASLVGLRNFLKRASS